MSPFQARGAQPVPIDGPRSGGFVRDTAAVVPPPTTTAKVADIKDPVGAVAAAGAHAIWWVSSLDGGVGRSTVAIAMAALLQPRGGCLVLEHSPRP